MTKAYTMYRELGEEFREYLKEMPSAMLLQLLEDTTQEDMLQMSSSQWLCDYREKAVYERIIVELGERLAKYETELGIKTVPEESPGIVLEWIHLERLERGREDDIHNMEDGEVF